MSINDSMKFLRYLNVFAVQKSFEPSNGHVTWNRRDQYNVPCKVLVPAVALCWLKKKKKNFVCFCGVGAQSTSTPKGTNIFQT